MYSGWQEKGCVRDINYMITEKFLFAACHRKDRSTRVRYKKLTEFDDGSYAVSYYKKYFFSFSPKLYSVVSSALNDILDSVLLAGSKMIHDIASSIR